MVLSLGYLLTELKKKAGCHTAQIDALDNKADELSKQAITIENKLEEVIDFLIDTLLRRKENLKGTLWQIVAREDEQLARKKAEIMEHMNMLTFLEETASEDVARFRELYGNAAERSDQLDVESDSLFSLKMSYDCQELVNAIQGFGGISCDVCEQGDLDLFYASHSDSDSKGQSHCVDVDFDITSNEVECCGSPECAFDPLSCNISSCCNYCDVSEEQNKAMVKKQTHAKDASSSMKQWLVQPREICPIEGDAFALEGKIVSQLESLQLSKLEEEPEMSNQEAFAIEFQEDMKCWLVSKQEDSLDQNAKDGYVRAQKSAVCKVWDDIKAKQVVSWLKVNPEHECLAEERSKDFDSTGQLKTQQSSKYNTCLKETPLSMETEVQEPSKNVAQYENLLRMSHLIKLEDNTDSNLEMESVKERDIHHGAWLKRKYIESSEEQEMKSTQVFKRIKNTPLESWLKKPESNGNGHEFEAGSFKIESKSVKKADFITRTPLAMWLKCTKVPGSVMQRKYAKWLVPREMVNKGIVYHKSQSMVLQQFDEISKSCLSGWMKNVGNTRKPTKPDLCKWLKSGSEESFTSHYSKSDTNFTF